MTDFAAQHKLGDAVLLERAAARIEARFVGHDDTPSRLRALAAELRRQVADAGCGPWVTKDGTVITDDQIREWADEAERGYDPARLRPRS